MASALRKTEVSPSEALRAKTNYDAGSGFSPLYHAQLVDIRRLTSGPACTFLLLGINAIANRPAAIVEKLPAGQDGVERSRRRYPDAGFTDFLSLEDWAELAGCDVRTVQRERDYLILRKIIEGKTDKSRRFAFRLRYRQWEALEDYKTWLSKQPKVVDESDDEPGPDDPAALDVKPGTVLLLKAKAIKRGAVSKAVKVDCGIRSVRFDNRSGVDCRVDLMVKAGELWITPQAQLEQEAKGVKKAKGTTSKGTYEIPDDTDVVGKGENKAKLEKRTIGENHPRGTELLQIFNPLLQNSGSRLLDDKALADCCHEIGETPHDYALRFIIDRASTRIAGPRICVLICRDARKAWEAGHTISPKPAAKSNFVEGVKEVARRRLEKYGRI